MNPFSNEKLNQIFKLSTRNPNLIGTNEGISIEYKKSFGWKSISDYLKAMASFANREGGYIIFGIKDKSHELLGLKDRALNDFSNIDNEQWSTHLRKHFAPEIIWDKRIYDFNGQSYGVIYTYPSANKPVICKEGAGELRKAAIYYRYNSQNSEIDYPELANIIEHEKNKIHQDWMKMVKQIGDNGISKTALLDLKSGKMTGNNTNLYIDETLLEEITFVQEGSFVETGGDPALVVKGEVQTVIGAQRVIVEKDRDRAINSDAIIKKFITQSCSDFAEEYIKQICYQTTGNLPVYYYMDFAGLSVTQTIQLVDSVPPTTQAKTMLIDRLNRTSSDKHIEATQSNSIASNAKNKYRQAIIDNSLELPVDEKNMKYCIMAFRMLTAIEVQESKDYILEQIFKIYTDYFYNSKYNAIKPEFRYTLCWIDEALYMK